MDSVRLLKRIMVQGNNSEIQRLFTQIVKAARAEFTEDNEPTLGAFLAGNLFTGFAHTLDDITTLEYVRKAMIGALDETLAQVKAERT